MTKVQMSDEKKIIKISLHQTKKDIIYLLNEP